LAKQRGLEEAKKAKLEGKPPSGKKSDSESESENENEEKPTNN